MLIGLVGFSWLDPYVAFHPRNRCTRCAPSAIRFFRFSAAQRHADATERRRRFSADTLTTADVEAEFERLGPPPSEPRL